MRSNHKFAARLFLSLLSCLILSSSAAAQGFDRAEFAARRSRLFERIGDGLALVVAGEPHVHAVKFRQSPDFFYLTGIEEPGAVLLMVGKTKQALVFAEKRGAVKVMVEGPGLLERGGAAEAYGLTGVLPLESLTATLTSSVAGARKVYLQLTPPDSLQMGRSEIVSHERALAAHPLYRFTPPSSQVAARVRELLPGVEQTDVSPLLDQLRWVKTPYEIERLRKSGRIGAEGVKAAIKGTRPGMYEYEVEAAAHSEMTRLGARGHAFTPIVASGPNTVTWHYERNDRQMQAGDVVLMDYGADYDYYTSDITRTWPVSGAFTPEQEKMYRCILEARDRVIAAIKPGVTVKQLQDVSEAVYKKHGFLPQFMQLGRYVGHHVGLSVHDVGSEAVDQPFRPGVVFNVEPLIEFRDRQIHMRLEDTVLVTETGAENLTAGVPADVAAVYALIKQKN
ncbi:MAG TPA: Xaa-Pro peptidase family protein [Pyrinomonadaceae bacterium]|jgi:Xaa-Pro aminopeptidase|nr:Xaa-Pro peptidase family protein [Pyrinomonadaceae bacterium]